MKVSKYLLQARYANNAQARSRGTLRSSDFDLRNEKNRRAGALRGHRLFGHAAHIADRSIDGDGAGGGNDVVARQ